MGRYWITNSAVDAKWAVVFAQLIIRDKGHGVHGFLTRIRDEVAPVSQCMPVGHPSAREQAIMSPLCVLQAMRPMPNVRIEDMGHKMGTNGVDNGKLWFDGKPTVLSAYRVGRQLTCAYACLNDNLSVKQAHGCPGARC